MRSSICSSILITLICFGLTACTPPKHQQGHASQNRPFVPIGEHTYNHLVLTKLMPGMHMDEAFKVLRRERIIGSNRLPIGHYVFEAAVLDSVYQRQRLVLTPIKGRLRQAAVIIDFENVGNLDTPEQTFQRILNELVSRYGRPDFSYERGLTGGRFPSSGISRAVGSGSLMRIHQWTLEFGTLRFGIPRRLDRQTRMELHYMPSKHTPAFGESLWSVEEVF